METSNFVFFILQFVILVSAESRQGQGGGQTEEDCVEYWAQPSQLTPAKTNLRKSVIVMTRDCHVAID